MAVAPVAGGKRIAFALALLAAAPSWAAPVNIDNDDNEALQRSALVSLPKVDGRGWLLNLSLQSRYESNLARLVPAEPGARLTPQATAGIGLPFGRQQLFFGGRYGRDLIYGVDSLPSRNRYAYGGGIGWQLGARCEGVVAGEVSSNLAIFNEAASTLDNALRMSTYGAEATCRFGGRLSINGSAQHRTFTNSNPLRAAFDSRADSFSAGIGYAAGPFGNLSLSGSIDDRTFVGRQTVTAAGPVDDGLLNRSLQFGWSRGFGSRINLSLNGSYIKASPKPDSQLLLVNGVPTSVDRASFSGIGYSGSLALAPTSRLQLKFDASRQVRATPNVAALYMVVDIASVDMDYKLSQRMGFGLGASRLHNQFRGAFVSPGDNRVRVSDKIDRFYANINYSPRQRYGMSLEANYFRRNSVPSTFNVDSFAVVLNLKVNLGRSQ